jgi:hypothetical protein
MSTVYMQPQSRIEVSTYVDRMNCICYKGIYLPLCFSSYLPLHRKHLLWYVMLLPKAEYKLLIG